MKIDITKKYETVTGLKVKLYDIVDSTQKYCVIGAIYGEAGIWHPTSWNALGKNIDFDTYNLIEIVDFAVTRIDETYVKTCEYFGISVVISNNIKWLATDKHGAFLYGYFSEPYLSMGDYWDSEVDSIRLAKIKYEGDWKQSKLKVV